MNPSAVDKVLDAIRAMDVRDRSRFIATIALEMSIDMKTTAVECESVGLQLPWVNRPNAMCFVFAKGPLALKLDKLWRELNEGENVVCEVAIERGGL